MRSSLRFFAVLYFAYGANTNAGDFARWCSDNRCDPGSLRAPRPAWLPDHAPAFRSFSRTREGGTLDVVPRLGCATPGVLFEVDGWEMLDRKEGRAYERVTHTVLLEDTSPAVAETYMVRSDRREDHVEPAPDYVEIVCAGLEAHGLPTRHVRDAAEARARALPLFVYGTLMSGEVEHARVVSRGRKARIRGRLLALPAGYPGAIAGEGTIHGELADVEDWAALDAYEGAPSLFRRVVVRASREHAWAYFYAGSLEGASPIASGDWRQR